MIEIDEDIKIETKIPAGKYFTVKETVLKTGINESVLRTWISRGKIPSVLFDGKRLISEEFLKNVSVF